MKTEISVPRTRTARAFKFALAMSAGIAVPAALALTPTPVGATPCPLTASGNCAATQVVTGTIAAGAGSLSVTAPAGFGFAALSPGGTVGPTNLGLLNFTDTLNDATNFNISATSTDLYCNAGGCAGKIGSPFTAVTFTPGNQFQAKTGAVGTPANGASGNPAGVDTTPGTTFGSTGVSLVGSTAPANQGSWDEAPVADACTVTTGVTTATAGCNQITAIINATATAGNYSMTVQYTITG